MPFLIAHGDVVWKFLIVVLSIGSASLQALPHKAWRCRLLGALSWAFVWYGAMHVVGDAAVHSMPPDNVDPSGYKSTAIAISMPDSRAIALDRIAQGRAVETIVRKYDATPSPSASARWLGIGVVLAGHPAFQL